MLCITHLPQIAVFAATHFKVEKTTVDERTVSVVPVRKAPPELEAVVSL